MNSKYLCLDTIDQGIRIPTGQICTAHAVSKYQITAETQIFRGDVEDAMTGGMAWCETNFKFNAA
jgi:hypothetical protein